jgi:hypothetical protein
MLLPSHQNAEQNDNIRLVNRVFEDMMRFKYVETIMKIQYLIHKEIKSRLISGNACNHSIQNLVFSRLLSKNKNIRIYKTIILPVVLYGRETLSLALSEEHRLKLFENRMLRRIFGPKWDKIMACWRRFAK